MSDATDYITQAGGASPADAKNRTAQLMLAKAGATFLAVNPDKSPKGKWKEATFTDPRELDSAAYGVRLPKGMLVLDFDGPAMQRKYRDIKSLHATLCVDSKWRTSPSASHRCTVATYHTRGSECRPHGAERTETERRASKQSVVDRRGVRRPPYADRYAAQASISALRRSKWSVRA